MISNLYMARVLVFPVVFLVFQSCYTVRIQENYRFTGKSLFCESSRFPEFGIFKSYDKNRICVYEKQNINKEKKTKKHTGFFNTHKHHNHDLRTGLDIAADTGFSFLNQTSFAVFTNLTGVDSKLNYLLDLLVSHGYLPSLLIEPEHGIYGAEDRLLENTLYREQNYGIPVLSLYSEVKKPPLHILKNIDTIVVDIMNLPVRSYTYVSTLTYILEAADLLQKEVVVLDRPHTYGIWDPAGNFLVEGYESFVSEAPVPFLYNLTPGEYSIFMSLYKFKNLKLKVIKLENFHPEKLDWVMNYTWTNPSPNIPDWETSLVYPAIVILEGLMISVGRGTTKPFLYSGAPWMDSKKVVNELKRADIKGVKVNEIIFRPSFSLYKDELCYGIQIRPYSQEFHPVKFGFEYAKILYRLHKDRWSLRKSGQKFLMDKLWGSDTFRRAVELGLSFEAFANLWKTDIEAYKNMIKEVIIYRDVSEE